MNIHELSNFNLADAVKFHDRLNPGLWAQDEHLRPEVRQALLSIADDFREFLGVDDLEVKDITISGSNAAYNYTDSSDIDLHLVVDLPEANDEVYRELFNAKKYQYNDQHDIRVRGSDVELYVQPASDPHVSQGVYSILHNKWLQVPRRRKASIDDDSVRHKVEDLSNRITAAVNTQDHDTIAALAQKIKDMRATGLKKNGEFGVENIAFKLLRNQGLIKTLHDARAAARDQELSLKERSRKRSRTRYGYGQYWFPGYHNSIGQDNEIADGGDGIAMEQQAEPKSDEAVIRDFFDYCIRELKIKSPPELHIHDDADWANAHSTFGMYRDDDHTMHVVSAGRHIMDVLRTLAHEMRHARQHELANLPVNAGETGSPWEDDANAMAGRLMRHYGRDHPELFTRVNGTTEGIVDTVKSAMSGTSVVPSDTRYGSTAYPRREAAGDVIRTPVSQDQDNKDSYYRFIMGKLRAGRPVSRREQDFVRTYRLYQDTKRQVAENASGYIPSAREKNDPRFSMGLSVDIKPDSVKKNAAKLGSRIARDGRPPLLMKTANLLEAELAQQFARFKKTKQHGYGSTPMSQVPGSTEDDLNNQEATGPEFPPQMPAGTTKIDVSDLTDWYRLGMDISDLDDAKPENYNQGPPQTVIVFPSDEAEQAYLKQFKRLGLKTHDMDPDVQGGEDVTGKHLRKKLADKWRKFKEQDQTSSWGTLAEDQDLLEVKMSPSELERWAASPEAAGIQAGFEAELIFRDTQSGPDEEEYEPDYDMDERPGSIDEVIDFFSSGDNGIGRNTANRLRESLYEEYIDWREEAIADEWSNVAEEQVQDYMETNVWGDDGIQDQYRQQAAEELGIETSEESADQAEAIETLAREKFEAEVQEQIEEAGRYYDEAQEYFRDMAADSNNYDEGEFLDYRYRYMSDIEQAFGLDWPYWRGGETRNSGGRTTDDIANSLSRALGGAEVRASSGYHSTARKPGRWIVEPDGSLDPDDSSEETGLEIVSPPMPLPQALKSLRTVIDWANDTSEGDAYTNSSTGLHMGISIPHKGGDVDYVKLIMFMGDQYVLDQFGRAANSYCASALGKLRQTQTARRQGVREQDMESMTGSEKTAAAMDLMKKNLIELAARYVQDGVGKSKYTSAHAKDDYIEFRSPGGDYLAMDDRDESALQNTMLRFARAMYIAGRPDLERKEYAKKLYKLIDAQGDEALKLFLDYNTGKINAEELKKQWAKQVLAKEAPPPRSRADAKEYEVVNTDTGEVIDVIRDWNLDSANETALVKYSDKGFNFSVREKTDVEPEKKLSRRAQVAKKIVDRPTVWHVENTDNGKVLLIAAANARDAQYEAMRQDPEFERISREDPDSFFVHPATAAEVKQYQEQHKDDEKDSEQVQQRVQGQQRYRVQWTERRGDGYGRDSLVTTAANADAAMDSVRSAVQAQGRRVISIEANLVGSTQDLQQQRANQPSWGDQLRQELSQYSDQTSWRNQREYHIYNRSTNMPVVAFIASSDEAAMERLEQYRQQHPSLDVGVRTGGVTAATRHQLPQSEFTGRWLVKDRQGNVVYTFSGVGNSQTDANRTAQTWLLAQGDRLDNQGPFEIVPEMSE